MRCIRYLVISCAILITAFVVWYIWHSGRRPLFHEEYISERYPNIFTTWEPTCPVADHQGSIAYFDLYLNMIVVVVTEKKDLSWFASGIHASPSDAVLLADTPYRVHVDAIPNTLLLFKDNEKYSLPIEPGKAEQWHQHLIKMTNKQGWTLLDELEQICTF